MNSLLSPEIFNTIMKQYVYSYKVWASRGQVFLNLQNVIKYKFIPALTSAFKWVCGGAEGN